MKNLLQETREAITKSGHSPDDVVFIGSEQSGHACTWGEFTNLADRDYDSGFGAAQVATDLVVVFRDGQKMWRGEHDGSEWWEYGTPFVAPAEPKPIRRIIGDLWPSLAELNDGVESE